MSTLHSSNTIKTELLKVEPINLEGPAFRLIQLLKKGWGSDTSPLQWPAVSLFCNSHLLVKFTDASVSTNVVVNGASNRVETSQK